MSPSARVTRCAAQSLEVAEQREDPIVHFDLCHDDADRAVGVYEEVGAEPAGPSEPAAPVTAGHDRYAIPPPGVLPEAGVEAVRRFQRCLDLIAAQFLKQVGGDQMTVEAADVLLERIRAGEWALGAKLPGETTLAPQLGVGRSTVREAIRQLAGRGILDSRQGSGVYVTALDASDDWEQVLRRADIATVIEARTAIEVEAATLAAVRRTPTDLRAIRRALESRTVPGQSVEDHVDADMALHRAIVVAAHNEVLVELFDGFVPRVRRAMVDMLRIRPVQSESADHDAHAAVVDAIAQRLPDAASQASRTHLDALKAGFV